MTFCRLCLAKDGNFLAFNSPVALRIMTCTGVEVDTNDALPQLLCHTCRLRIEEFYHYRKRCQAVDRHLRRLKRQGRLNSDCPAKDLYAVDEEDEINLKDVVQCKLTACYESNAKWRKQAGKQIRTEMDAYKKELLAMCRQQVREEIEQETREEMEKMLLAKARKECRLSILDDVFYELETFFVNKRNQTLREEIYVPTACEADPENDTTTMDEDMENNEVPEPLAEYTGLEPNITAKPSTPMKTIPMVEINMNNGVHLRHLRDDMHSSILPTLQATNTLTSPKVKTARALPNRRKTIHFSNPICRKHSLKNKHRSSFFIESDCVKCRLRNGQAKPTTP
ncbi:CG31457 [Drosophila busckii]|uniref:CG31457 n=1 Tax=Drosophila busckii TaxID=30019 RepID=A0A0M5J552_DROBS|nr:CG31457 [Drosophila busckii]